MGLRRVARVSLSRGYTLSDLQNLLWLEQAIRRVTSAPAKRFKLEDRGTIKPGARADAILIDLEGFMISAQDENPTQLSSGVD